MKEKKIPFNTSEKRNLKIYYELVIQIKTLIHLAYDSIYVKENTQVVCDPSWITVLDSIMTGLKQLDFTDLKKIPSSSTIALDPKLFTQENRRIGENLNLMVDHYHLILENLSHLN